MDVHIPKQSILQLLDNLDHCLIIFVSLVSISESHSVELYIRILIP